MTDGGDLLEFLRRLLERRSADAHGAFEDSDWGAYLSKYEADFARAPRRRSSLLKAVFGTAPCMAQRSGKAR